MRSLREQSVEAAAQVESLRQLTSQQNNQLAALKEQTESAIRSREEMNNEVFDTTSRYLKP